MGKKLTILISTLTLAACTQKPVEVVYKGGNHYDNRNTTQMAAAPVETVRQDETPAMVLTRRESPKSIFITDNMSAAPVKSEEEFRRVVDNIKRESAKADRPITVVAIPVEKPANETEVVKEIADFGVSGLHAVKPMAKPQAPQAEPQWYAQQADEGNVTEGFIWPLRGKLVSTFGDKQNGAYNDGINIAAPEGKAIKAAADGEVVYAGNELAGYGNMIIVRHNNGWMSAYAHTHKMHVGLSSKVAQGQTIAEVGKTGDVETAQLHFGLRKDKQAVNPLDFLTDTFAANY